MAFEWDEAKRLRTLADRGFDFVDAAGLFDGRPALTVRSDYGEEVRFMTVGLLRGKYCTIVWTWRGENHRIISFRRSRRGEERAYHAVYG